MAERPKVWMTEEEYQLVSERVPISCVDLVILREGKKGWETLLIIRKTGYEKGKHCIIGGRQRMYETHADTINRQAGDMGIKVKVIPPFAIDFPAWVNSHLDQDKTKQPVCAVYPVVIIEGELRPEGEEYSSFKWVGVDSLPEMGYDHQFEVEAAVRQLRRFKASLRS